jgi:hypothetical protein
MTSPSTRQPTVTPLSPHADVMIATGGGSASSSPGIRVRKSCGPGDPRVEARRGESIRGASCADTPSSLGPRGSAASAGLRRGRDCVGVSGTPGATPPIGTTADNPHLAPADFALSESPRYVGAPSLRRHRIPVGPDGTGDRSAPVSSHASAGSPTSTAHSPTSGDASRRSASPVSTQTPTIIGSSHAKNRQTAARFLRLGLALVRRAAEGSEEGCRVRDGAEDAAGLLDERQRRLVVLPARGADAVLEHEAVVAPVQRL